MFCCSLPSLQIKIKTLQFNYNQEEGQIFDFNKIVSKIKPNLLSKKMSLILKDKGEQIIIKQGYVPNANFLIQIDQNMQDIILTENLALQDRQTLWRVLTKQQKQQVQQGDRIKLGQFQLSVYQINDNKQVIKSQLSQQGSCRYCLSNTSTIKDPLINICNCSGSVKYLHLSCLRQWLNSKCQILEQQQQQTFFVYKKSHCEICKYEFPIYFFHKNRKYRLFQFNNPQQQQQFIVLYWCKSTQLTVNFQFYKQNQAYIFLKLIINKPITLGSSDGTDVMLDNQSIQMFHCSLNFEKNKLMIDNLSGKYGTLINAKKQQQLKSKSQLSFIYGNKLISFLELQQNGFFSYFKQAVNHKLSLRQKIFKQLKFQSSEDNYSL